MSDGRILVGDIGGTHARFAIAEPTSSRWKISNQADVESGAPEFGEVLRGYLAGIGQERLPGAASLAVAGPVFNGRVTFTNRAWQLTESDLIRFGFRRALLINDFAALAFAAAQIPPDNLCVIGPDISGLADQPVSIVGAGTGFGAAVLARYRGRGVPIATEGGHMGFAPGNDEEIAVLRILARRFGRVSIERVLSGPGLENVFSALHEIAGSKAEPRRASEIVEQASRGDPVSVRAQNLFCAVYGAVAGDIALAHGARGGVFIAGGIAQKIKDVLANSEFRTRFEDKGRLSDFVRAIPTRLILDGNATLIGAAIASQESADAK